MSTAIDHDYQVIIPGVDRPLRRADEHRDAYGRSHVRGPATTITPRSDSIDDVARALWEDQQHRGHRAAWSACARAARRLAETGEVEVIIGSTTYMVV